MEQKKRNTKHIPQAEFEEFDREGNLILENLSDEYEVRFYHSPKFDFLYIYIFDPEDMKYTNGESHTKHFKRLFPKALPIPTEQEFDRLYRLHRKAKVIPVAADYILDQHEEDEAD